MPKKDITALREISLGTHTAQEEENQLHKTAL